MKLELFEQKAANLWAENRGLKFFSLMVLLANAITVTMLYRQAQDVRMMVVPVGAAGNLWVSGDEASDDLLRHMARYITHQIGTYTASTARAQFEEVLSLFAPEAYSEAKAHFDKLADQIERYSAISSILTWAGNEPLVVEPNRMRITARKQRLSDGSIVRNDRLTYEIQYRIRGGRFWIERIAENRHDA